MAKMFVELVTIAINYPVVIMLSKFVAGFWDNNSNSHT